MFACRGPWPCPRPSDRYHNHLDADLKKLKWSTEEEQLLLQLQAELGNKWSTISRQLPGRYGDASTACVFP